MTIYADNPENVRHWIKLCKTDPSHTKPFQKAGGFRGTDISPAYRVQRLTEQFGPCGQGWGYTIHEHWRESFGEQECVFVQLSLWWREGEERYETGAQIGGTVADRTPDESYKMAVTDALGKCALLLGVSADVYLGEFDGSKYREGSQPPSGNSGPPPQQRPSSNGPYQRQKCPKCGREDSVFKDKEKPNGFYCWKKKEGCGYTWILGEHPEKPPPAGEQPKPPKPTPDEKKRISELAVLLRACWTSLALDKVVETIKQEPSQAVRAGLANAYRSAQQRVRYLTADLDDGTFSNYQIAAIAGEIELAHDIQHFERAYDTALTYCGDVFTEAQRREIAKAMELWYARHAPSSPEERERQISEAENDPSVTPF
jgi:hypothetical protein